MMPLPTIACTYTPSCPIDRGAFHVALERLVGNHYGEPTRVMMKRPSEGEAACTLSWRGDDVHATLRVRTTPTQFFVRLTDQDLTPNSINIVVVANDKPNRPDDRRNAINWAYDLAIQAYSNFLAALSFPQEIILSDNRNVTIASRVGSALRLREKHQAPLSRLVLRSPWDPAEFGDKVDFGLWDNKPLAPDADYHLTHTLPPAVMIKELRSDGLSFRLERAAFMVGSTDIPDAISLLREMATWKRP